MKGITTAFRTERRPLALHPNHAAAKDGQRPTRSVATLAPVSGPKTPLSPPDSHTSDGTTSSPSLMSHANAPSDSGDNVHTDRQSLSAIQQEQVLQLRDHLVDLFERSDRQTAWHPLFKNIAETFNLALGQIVPPSDLLNALPSMQKELRALSPARDEAKLEIVRETFINMGGTVFSYLEEEHLPRWCEPREPWYLPRTARTHPRQFWGKVWDSFDFSSPQYIDTTLPRTEQHPDVVVYLYALGYAEDRTVESLQYVFGALEQDEVYDLGVRFLQGTLKHGHGIKIRQQENEPAIPFPWLDCRLSRFKSLGWSFEQEYDESHCRDRWIIDYHDLDRSDPLPPPRDGENPFAPFSCKDALLTKIRVPVPRPLLARPESIYHVLSVLYTDTHPLHLLGEARTLAFELAGDPTSDDDLRAAMLFAILSRIANYEPGIWDVILGET